MLYWSKKRQQSEKVHTRRIFLFSKRSVSFWEKVAVVNKFIGKTISAFIKTKVAKFAKLRTSKILDYKIKTAKNRMEFCACSLLYKIQTFFKGFETPKFYVFYQTAFKLPVKIQVSRKCVFKKH